jgi:hypothetical protein
MDVKCEPSCVFSTGSCSDSVRELECKPAPNKLTMVSSVDAASLFFCNWVSCGCCRWTLSVLSSCSLCAFFCCYSFSKATKATSCIVAAPGDPRCRGACLGSLPLRLDVDLARVLLLDQSNARIVLRRLLSFPPFQLQRGGWLRMGRLGSGPLVIGLEPSAVLLCRFGFGAAARPAPFVSLIRLSLVFSAASSPLGQLGDRQAAPLAWRRCVSS